MIVTRSYNYFIPVNNYQLNKEVDISDRPLNYLEYEK